MDSARWGGSRGRRCTRWECWSRLRTALDAYSLSLHVERSLPRRREEWHHACAPPHRTAPICVRNVGAAIYMLRILVCPLPRSSAHRRREDMATGDIICHTWRVAYQQLSAAHPARCCSSSVRLSGGGDAGDAGGSGQELVDRTRRGDRGRAVESFSRRPWSCDVRCQCKIGPCAGFF